ncbi:hypothetical protein EBH_0076440 [Eimeria brunetti]|uniref:Uncharacterized protein n=1 Tax=Eimeria brunetti TaxID=51314 RepID=U6LXT0_9EIME|nr:hypothetical protein EBH_0076440 [Eimeria brunetti]
MTVRTHPSDSTQDDSCPKSGDSSVEAGLCLASLKDAKASHITGGDDWFPTSQWPSSGSNSSNSTGRHCSDRRLAMHERAVDLEPPVTSSENCEFSEKLLRARDYWNTHGNAVRETGIEPVHGIPNNAGGTSEPFSLKGTGSPRDSTFSPSLGIVGDTAEDSQLPLQGVNSATNRNHAKTSLVCGPLSVQQTLTERQLDIEKRMLEVRQQNRRRLYRRQQEAKEQQLQRMREHRAALLARREKIKLASLWKERGMAAAARTAAICKERGKLERLPSEPSQPTENDNRSADELLAALVISESISLQTELGSREGDICAGQHSLALW